MTVRRGYRWWGALLLGLGASSGCYSGVNEFGAGDQPGASDGVGDADGGASGSADDDASPGPDGLGPADELPAPTTRFFRMTHSQWENTVQDLLYLDEPTGLSGEFRVDPFVGGFAFDNNALSLQVDQALWQGYQRAAVELAQMVADDPSVIAAIAPAAGDEAARIREFVETFGMRAFRRPLSGSEVEEYVTLFGRGDALYEDTSGFEAGIRLVLEGMLQSPFFLYRVERSEEVVDDVIPLDSWEIASRLSFLLSNSMPDDALLEAAANDSLQDTEEVRAHVLRLLESSRGVQVVDSFHRQLLGVKKFTSASPSPDIYPDAPDNLGELAIEENERFVEHIVFAQDGSWRDLLTSSETFVNDELAKIYGLEGSFGPEFERVDLDPAERSGILTQVGFLAANSTSANADPIHRGLFLAETMACMSIAAPPNDIPTPPIPDPTQTNREAVVELTEIEGTSCVACHKTIINPFGFALENYDATGAYRTTDNDKPVDATATLRLPDGDVDIDGGVAMSAALAEDSGVHRCYMQHWLEFAMARPHDKLDEPLTDRLADSSLDDLSVKEMLVEMATSRPFLTRAAEELE